MTQTLEYKVAERFASYTIHEPVSSNVAYFGYKEDQFFIQFKNGSAYLYTLSDEVIQGAINAESIGKYFSAEVSRKHTSIKLTESVIIKS